MGSSRDHYILSTTFFKECEFRFNHREEDLYSRIVFEPLVFESSQAA